MVSPQFDMKVNVLMYISGLHVSVVWHFREALVPQQPQLWTVTAKEVSIWCVERIIRFSFRYKMFMEYNEVKEVGMCVDNN